MDLSICIFVAFFFAFSICFFFALFLLLPGKKAKKKQNKSKTKAKKKANRKSKKKQQKCKWTSPCFSHFFPFLFFLFVSFFSLLFCFCVFWILLICFLGFPFVLHFSRFFSSFKKIRISYGLVNITPTVDDRIPIWTPSARKRPPSCWFEAAPAAPYEGPGKTSCAGVAGSFLGWGVGHQPGFKLDLEQQNRKGRVNH